MWSVLLTSTAVALAMAWPSWAGRAAGQGSDAPRVVAVCTVPGEGSARTFRLEAGGPSDAPRWFLALSDASTKGQWLRVALPDARPQVALDGVTLDHRSANGGVIVLLEARRDASLLDVYVSYELEVNIEPDLDPKVDLLNTDGPRRDAVCRRGDAPIL